MLAIVLVGRAPGNDMMYILDYRYRGCVSELWRQKSFELDARVYTYVNIQGASNGTTALWVVEGVLAIVLGGAGTKQVYKRDDRGRGCVRAQRRQ